MIEEVRDGKRESEIPPHGTLIRVRRSSGLQAPREEIATQRASAQAAREARAAKEQN
jgi:hypothetical protein